MIFALLVAAAIVSASALTQPSSLDSTPRKGRQAEVRFVSRLSNPGSGFKIGNPSGAAYSSQTVKAKVQIGNNLNADSITVSGGSSLSAFEEIDVGASGSAKIVLELQTSPVANIVCSALNSVAQATRVTVEITQSVTAPVFVPSSCVAGSGTCVTSTIQTNGFVTLGCNVFVDELDTADCATLPVRFYNEFSGCELKVENVVAETANTETFFTDIIVPTSFGSGVVELERAVSYAINDGALFTPSTQARSVDVFISSAGVVTNDESFTTAFINVANLAYRTVAAARANTFRVVISQSSSLSDVDQVVHFSNSITAASTMGWIEVPAGVAYTVFLFDDTVTQVQIFGDNSLASPTGSTSPQQLATSLTLSALATNELRIVRITSPSSGLALNSVPLNSASVTNGENVPAGSTQHVIWNNIPGTDVRLANPDDDCCNFINDGDVTAAESSADADVTGNANTLTPLARSIASEDFDVFDDSATCDALGAQIVATDVTLADSTAANECAVEGIFLHGRLVTVTTPACTSTATGVSSCNTPVRADVSSQVVATLTSVPTSTSESSDIDLHVKVELCSCLTASDVCLGTVDCALQAELDELRALINNVQTSVTDGTTSVNANVDDVESDVAALSVDLRNVNTTQNDNADKLTARVAAVQSSVNTVNTATTAIRSDVAVVRTAVNKLKKDIKKVGKDVKDLN